MTHLGVWLCSVGELVGKLTIRARAFSLRVLIGIPLRKLGRFTKLKGLKYIDFGPAVSIGDFCWIEAVPYYEGEHYRPSLRIGARVAISDLTHISCVNRVSIGDDCLLGSKIYIGDHGHGTLGNKEESTRVAPAKRKLGDIGSIEIGSNSWIGDGAVILAGTSLAPFTVVGANSVVKLKTERAALIAGVPARVVRYLD